MAATYPSILFHFTSRCDILMSILSGGFRPSMAREKIESTKKDKEFAVPMVSFCDLRLSELKLHMDSYGK